MTLLNPGEKFTWWLYAISVFMCPVSPPNSKPWCSGHRGVTEWPYSFCSVPYYFSKTSSLCFLFASYWQLHQTAMTFFSDVTSWLSHFLCPFSQNPRLIWMSLLVFLPDFLICWDAWNRWPLNIILQSWEFKPIDKIRKSGIFHWSVHQIIFNIIFIEITGDMCKGILSWPVTTLS